MTLEERKKVLEKNAYISSQEVDQLIAIEKVMALQEIGRVLSVCATQLENIEANTR